ncbi:AEC family transporter [Roseibium sp. MMSF_3544]|uniref:AEC family transporter n=1 Tax=unclassified Roseibium TaxID=2629323 RepID=UPI00273F75D8|nr:AEC family transporter [Roseibium sp. MMSF_3544]
MLAHTLSIVAPVFLLIGIGYCLARFGILKQSVSDALGQFVFVVAVPVLLFSSLTEADFSAENPFALWACYFLGVSVAWFLGSTIIRRGFGREARAGAIGGVSASFANLLLIGMPVVSAVYGEAGLVPILLVLSIHLMMMTVIITVAMERAAAIDSGQAMPPVAKIVLGTSRKVLTNPLIVAILLALVWRQTGLSLPEIGQDILDRIAATALPLALLSLGMSLVQYGIRGNILPGFLLSLIKIFIMPATIFLAGTFLFQLPPLWVAATTLAASCPTGVNPYIFANRYGTGHAMSANAITMTTLSAILTTSLWVWFLNLWFGSGLQ